MQRRPSHPHGQLTGLIVLVSLMLSVGVMFWLPGQPQLPAHAAAVATTGTASLPITRTPRAERGPVANMPVEPTMDWSTIPTAIPADQLVAEALAATAAAIPPTPVYVPVYTPPDNSALIATQQELAAAQAYAQEQAAAMKAQADAAFESQRQQDARHAADLAATQQTAPPAPPVVNPADFAAPDPNAKCQFVGCL